MKLKTNKIFFAFLLIFLFIISLVFVSAYFNNSNNILKVTEEHPFLLNGKWILAKELKVGDSLVTATGKKVRITGIRDVNESVEVYNLEVKNYSNFVVNGLVVHNSNKPLKEISVPEVSPEIRAKYSNGEQRPLSEVYEMGDGERIAYLESRLGKGGQFSKEELEAVLYAHYNLESISEKVRYLESKGISRIERDIILSEGIAGFPPLTKLESSANLDVLVRAGRGDTANLESIVSSNVEISSEVFVKRGISDAEAYALKEQIKTAHPDWSFEQVSNGLSKYGANFDYNSRSAKNLEGLVDGSGYAHAYGGHGPEAGSQKYFNSANEFDRALALGKTSPDIAILSPRGGVANRANYRLELDPAFPDSPFLTIILDSRGEFVTMYRQKADEVVKSLVENVGIGAVPRAETFISSGMNKNQYIIVMKIPRTNNADLIIRLERTSGSQVSHATFPSDFDTTGLISSPIGLSGSQIKNLKKDNIIVDLSGLN